MTQRVKPMREAWRQSLYTKCVGDIPDQQKFPDVLPCGRKHPGICRVDLTEDMLRAHAVVCKKVADLEIGTVITLEATKGCAPTVGVPVPPCSFSSLPGVSRMPRKNAGLSLRSTCRRMSVWACAQRRTALFIALEKGCYWTCGHGAAVHH